MPDEADDGEERDCPDDAAPVSSSLLRLASMACNADLLGPVNT